MVIWFTGQPGSGKTTLEKEFILKIKNKKTIHLDGDIYRDILNNHDYSKNGRIKFINCIQLLCKLLYNHFIIVVSVIAPYKDMRDNLKKEIDVLEIYVHTDNIRGKEKYWVKDYEKPIYDYVDINTNMSINECINKIYNIYIKRVE